MYFKTLNYIKLKKTLIPYLMSKYTRANHRIMSEMKILHLKKINDT